MVLIVLVLYFCSTALSLMLNRINEYDTDKFEDFAYVFYSIFILICFHYSKPNPVFFLGGMIFCSVFAGFFSIFEAINVGLSVRTGGPDYKPIVFGTIALSCGFMSLGGSAFFYHSSFGVRSGWKIFSKLMKS